MKDFFNKYSYSIIKMFVNQFAISLFGASLALATASSDNDLLTIIVSIGAVLFYMFLLYIMTWEIGAKDRISVDIGKKEYRPLTGFLLSLIANIPNYIIAILFTVGYFLANTHEGAKKLCFVVKTILVIIEGMFLGITSTVEIGEHFLNDFWWTYFVITLPSIITCGVAYYLGHKNIRFTSVLTYKDPNKK